MSSFKQGRLHFDAYDATQLASEGANLIGGAFKNDGNDAVITTGKALAADDDARVTGKHRVHLWRGFTVSHINKD